MKLSATPSLSPFYDRDISKLVISLEERRDETDRIRIREGLRGLLCELAFGQPSAEVQPSRRLPRGTGRETHPELQRPSGSRFDTGRYEILWQDRVSSAFQSLKDVSTRLLRGVGCEW